MAKARHNARPRKGQPPADPRKWDKGDVLRAVLRREAEGLPLNHGAVMKADGRLQRAALRLFGHWDRALLAAGVDPARARRHQRWDAQVVIHRIRALARDGKGLNSAAVQRFDANLVQAAFRYCESWENALALAGVDPDRHRKQPAPWTRDRVIRTILHIEAAGGALNHAAVASDPVKHAAVRLFGSWDAALRAAGLDPGKVRRYRRPWTAKSILATIRAKHRAAEPLAHSTVVPQSIIGAARRFYGSWDAALRAAGLDPARIRLYRTHCKPWAADTVLAEIRRKHRCGEPLNTHHVSPCSLRYAGVKFFGAWDAALAATGLDPAKVRRRPAQIRASWRG